MGKEIKMKNILKTFKSGIYKQEIYRIDAIRYTVSEVDTTARVLNALWNTDTFLFNIHTMDNGVNLRVLQDRSRRHFFHIAFERPNYPIVSSGKRTAVILLEDEPFPAPEEFEAKILTGLDYYPNLWRGCMKDYNPADVRDIDDPTL